MGMNVLGVNFFLNSVLLGVGLAMDAFSVSIANGLKEPHMKTPRMLVIAGVYAVFQFLMPVLGWIGVNFLTDIFTGFTKAVPWIALILLVYIGGKMIYEGVESLRKKRATENKSDDLGVVASDVEGSAVREDESKAVYAISYATLLTQGIATSIDALSTGFAIAEYDLAAALIAALIIAVVTFLICIAGVKLGRYFGMKLAGRATIVGGLILIFIGIKIWLGI